MSVLEIWSDTLLGLRRTFCRPNNCDELDLDVFSDFLND